MRCEDMVEQLAGLRNGYAILGGQHRTQEMLDRDGNDPDEHRHAEEAEKCERVATAIEQALAIVTTLADERLREIVLVMTDDGLIWQARIIIEGWRHFASAQPTKLDAIMWARRMFDQWDGGGEDG